MQIEIEIDFYLSADLRAISSSRAADRKMERTFQKHFAGKLWRRPVMK